jgi:ADP-heptose:LPS heptosyltransferase
MSRAIMVVRLDADGDVLLAGPALRAVAAGADRVVLLCGPRGKQAAHLLPGVDKVLVWAAPWIEPAPGQVSRAETERLIEMVTAAAVDEAVVLTSFHQSALPTALLLRLAGIARLTAISDDYPGSLLDVRCADPGDLPEPERGLSVVAAAGYRLPAGDGGQLAVCRPLPSTMPLTGRGPYVVVHPGTSVPARAWPVVRWAETVTALTARGHRVVVTGGPAERGLTAAVAGQGPMVTDLGGRTTLAELADVLDRAAAVVVANTGPAHLAAAVGTPVVSLFAPTVPARRWLPYGVPVELLGDQDAACAGSRATICPVAGHPCLSAVPADDACRAVGRLVEVAA